MIGGATLFGQMLLIAITLLPLADLAATLFFANLFLHSKRSFARDADGDDVAAVPGAEKTFISWMLGGRSWLLALLTTAFAIITLVFAFVGYLSARRLLGSPVEHSATYVAIALLLLGSIPIVFAVAFWRTRKKHGSPPPFGDQD